MQTTDIKRITEIIGEIVGKKIEEFDASRILGEISKEHYSPLDLDFRAPFGPWEAECNSCYSSRSDKCKRKGAKGGYLNYRIEEIAKQLGII